MKIISCHQIIEGKCNQQGNDILYRRISATDSEVLTDTHVSVSQHARLAESVNVKDCRKNFRFFSDRILVTYNLYPFAREICEIEGSRILLHKKALWEKWIM